MNSTNGRGAQYPIERMFLERWSPRGFTGEAIAEADLLTMLEAARWAPSCYNAQPWRFVYARRDTAYWDMFLDLLVPANRVWAKDASALVMLISNCLIQLPGADEDMPSPTHSFDAGTASGYFALQAWMMGWFTHGMLGFDKARASAVLDIPKGYAVEAIFAVGRLGDLSRLSRALQAREFPSDRLPLAKLVFEGRFQC
ncbi:MAG: nitroreductase family protein [Xanthobacteraceae bacterium]|nr:nitroreductase family protein [Xanthobacteraceae bacterium]